MLNNSALILNAKKSNLPVSSDPNFPRVLHKFMDAIGIFNGRSNELAFLLYQ